MCENLDFDKVRVELGQEGSAFTKVLGAEMVTLSPGVNQRNRGALRLGSLNLSEESDSEYT